MSSKLARKKIILAKLETTYGTDPTPTGAANAIQVKSLNFTPQNAQLANRDLIRPYLGNSPTLLADIFGSVDFEVELAPSGVAGTAPAWGALLKACGFAETIVATTSVTYAPVSSAFPSVTIYFYNDGTLHKLTGAMGNAEFSMSVKQIPTIKFTFSGLYNAPSETSNPSVDYTAFIQPKVVNTANTTTFSLHSFSGLAASMNLNMANQVQHVARIGGESIIFSDRKPAGTMVIEAPALSTKDFFAIAKAGTLGALSVVHGTGAGNITTFSAPNVSIQNPSYSEDSGVSMLSIPFVAVPSSGNDEISIALT